ncbi:MAG TPA: UvrD-helicase domain-containing protein [Microthrixaceae bacterium]|nr:UvrD-helicase domain-containing protein [Microthrixaceae bacterium]
MTDERSAARWSGPGWSIRIDHATLVIDTRDSVATLDADDASSLTLRRRWLRYTLHRSGTPLVALRGLTKADAHRLEAAIGRLGIAHRLGATVGWARWVADTIARAREAQRWISRETVDAFNDRRPDRRLADVTRALGLTAGFSEAELLALGWLEADLDHHVAEVNEAIVQAELHDCREFFDTIESSPLTEEQARAVICFDNRVQLLAAAGSGKTSVMVARAAYAVQRGFVPPERILLLAFNKVAATELQARITARFAAAGIDAEGIRASTFHAFGLAVIGRATGEKPRLAPWLDQGKDVGMVEQIVDHLRDRSPSFRYHWDLYRLVLSAVPLSVTTGEPDGYDRSTKESGFRTLDGKVVRSEGERAIADFLFLNGVRYEYERPYEHPAADATHSQYRPDFYYPDIGVWHEHWALDRTGRPPAEFRGYAEGMEWKRSLHAQFGTRLVETTWAEVAWGDGLQRLGETLERFGVALDWNPDRRPTHRWATAMQHSELARQVRTYMTHVKSNSLTRADLEARLTKDMAHLRGFRTKVFLDLYWAIHDEWQRRLEAEHAVDFEDMLVKAADHVAVGGVDMGYDLVLVDEFQDASRARARLVRGLVRPPGRFLLAVGDDWQSINRFAGADISVMTDFEAWFGRGPQLALTATFRCPQLICDAASAFVTRNPRQFDKPIRSIRSDPGAPILVLHHTDPGQALSVYLDRLSERVNSGDLPTSREGKVRVDVLVRYRRDGDLVPRRLPPNLIVTRRTIHGSKGLEADVVVLPNMAAGRHGFPSGIGDDPVLGLAMPSPDTFEHAEERRLFYVALTRARREVALIGPTTSLSPFVIELMDRPETVVQDRDGIRLGVCPACRRGALVARSGAHGTFLSCSRFPACRGTRSIPRTPTSAANA